MFDISPVQIIIVLAIALLIFGPKRLPGMGRDIGRGMRDFKAGITGEDVGPAATRTNRQKEQPTSDQPIPRAADLEPAREKLDEARETSAASVR